MKILMVHQNYPGQYREILSWLIAQGGHEIVFLTQRQGIAPRDGVKIVSYPTHHRPSEGAYALSKYWEECCGNGCGTAVAMQAIKAEGFTPDIILGHIGWGELTFVRQVWPACPVIGYFEYFFLNEGGSVGFDPEYPSSKDTPYIMHARNAMNFANLETVDRGVTPTKWQHDTFPKSFHSKFYTCHDGIRTDRLMADPDATIGLSRLAKKLTREDEVFTYLARNLEPVRGFHHFMRALPKILEARPNARALIIGGNEASYGKKSDIQGGYRAQMEQEVGKDLDWSRVHFLGRVPYADYRTIIQLSRCHIYLTVPFVLSWSLLESMSMQAPIVASGTAPVREVIKDGKTGLLADLLNPDEIAEKAIQLLSDYKLGEKLGKAARAQVVKSYDFEKVCLPQHLRQINALVPKAKAITLPKAK